MGAPTKADSGIEGNWGELISCHILGITDGFLQYHKRLYTLDSHVQDLSEKNMEGLGKWLQRKVQSCALRKAEATEGLRKCGVAIEVLREQWEAQKTAQTKPLPSARLIFFAKGSLIDGSLQDVLTRPARKRSMPC